MRLLHALAAVPALSVLLAAFVTAQGGRGPAVDTGAVQVGTDVARARASLMTTASVGTPIEVAFTRLRERGLSCSISKPPLANLTWRVIECSTAPSPAGATLQVDVAGRNGVVADIGVEDRRCVSRADSTDPDPGAVDCDISGKRLLAVEARQRAEATAYVAEVLNVPSAALDHDRQGTAQKPPPDRARRSPDHEPGPRSSLRGPPSVKPRPPLRSNDGHLR